MTIAAILAILGIACIVGGYMVEESVVVQVDDSPAYIDELADDYDWAGQKIHDLDAA